MDKSDKKPAKDKKKLDKKTENEKQVKIEKSEVETDVKTEDKTEGLDENLNSETAEEKPLKSEGSEADVEDTDEMDAESDGRTGDATSPEKALLSMSAEAKAGMLALLHSRLNNIVGQSSGYIRSLPLPVRRRVKALKKIQHESYKLEAQFYREVHSLECKFADMHAPLQQKRFQFTSGKVDPTDEECDFPSSDEDEEIMEESSKKDKADDNQNPPPENAEEVVADACPRGIPEFWLTIFKNIAMLADMIQDHDEPVLRHLIDVTVTLHEGEPMGFTLFFHFEPNDFFTNTVLQKEYEMKCEANENNPFSFDGPEIVKCKGCSIDWKRGKNVTVKTVKKKQKHRSRGSVRTVLKTVPNDSFFNYFSPPAIPEEGDVVDTATEDLLRADFEIGHFLKERVVPRAVLYFTGEALTDPEDDDDEEEDDDEEGEDGDSDPDYKIDKRLKNPAAPPDCKQQ